MEFISNCLNDILVIRGLVEGSLGRVLVTSIGTYPLLTPFYTTTYILIEERRLASDWERSGVRTQEIWWPSSAGLPT